MADLARIARPLLLAPRRHLIIRTPAVMSSASCLGLGLRHGLGLGQKQKRDKFTAARPSPRSRKAPAQKDMMNFGAMPSLLLPLTAVPPPIWRFPRSPVKFAQLSWLLIKNRVQNLAAILGIYFVSMKGKGLSRPQFRAGRRAAIPTAKALHAQMSEAVAAGDKDTLRRICTPELFQTFAGAIDARPRGVRSEWELVRYDNRLRYPRLADFRVSYQPAGPASKGLKLRKQAVVSISSVQRLARYDDARGGEVVPGSERERHLVEHFVLQSDVKDGTFESEPWKIWGTLPEMSYETMREDAAAYLDLAATSQR
ncbi:hypothetical protein F5Y14DRAFT_455808 [Nemania sp. NC0429]|nr:hypothetical protein F5Y14DRAFT_455808 [Nemania sp. NC0429]